MDFLLKLWLAPAPAVPLHGLRGQEELHRGGIPPGDLLLFSSMQLCISARPQPSTN